MYVHVSINLPLRLMKNQYKYELYYIWSVRFLKYFLQVKILYFQFNDIYMYYELR